MAAVDEGARMFERFTDKARSVIVQALEEARSRSHDEIDTEHVLLGLLSREDTVAAKVLIRHGLALESLRSATEQLLPAGNGAPAGDMPFAARAKKTLELTLREALALEHNYIGTEHLLLGLLAQDEGIAAQVLRDHGVDRAGARADVVRILKQP